MRIFRFILSLIFMLSMAGVVQAKPDQLDRLQPRGFVSDFANIISSSEERQLISMITEVRQKTGAEIFVVTLQSLEGNEIDDFSNRLFEKWGIGQEGKDNGVLLLAAMKEHKTYIKVGDGLEAIIPDAEVERIQREKIAPNFRAGDLYWGIFVGVVELSQKIKESSADPMDSETYRSAARERESKIMGAIVYGAGIIVGVLGVIWLILCVFFPEQANRVYNSLHSGPSWRRYWRNSGRWS